MRARVLFAVLALSTVAACGGSSGSGSAKAAVSSSPSVEDTAAATQAITTTWETFFKGGGTVDAHIALLEDGEKFRPELTAQAKDPANAVLTAKVSKVTVIGTTAAVTYNLLGKAGAPLLTNAGGTAVKVDSTWKVSKKTFCQLIALQDPKAVHPGCTS